MVASPMSLTVKTSSSEDVPEKNQNLGKRFAGQTRKSQSQRTKKSSTGIMVSRSGI